MSDSKFTYPEFYEFPPFFTIQPVQATKQKQLSIWIEFVASYIKHHQLSAIKVIEDSKSPLFFNKKINRQLSVEGIREVLDEMVRGGFGKWDDEKKNICLLSHRKIDEWSNILYTWASENGLMDTISTIYELSDGDSTQGAPFHGLQQQVIKLALQELEKHGKVTLVPGDNLSETGVKFLSVK